VGKGRLLIRADANVAMGTGHVMRCLALAQAWQDAGGNATFAMAQPSAWAGERLSRESTEVLEISGSAGSEEDAEQTAVLAGENAADWIVVDGYQFAANYQRTLKAAGFKTLFLDDYGHCESYCADFVLNQNASADEAAYRNREAHTRLLLGPQYCLLRREFNAWREWRREIAPAAHRVLVTMGGADPENFTGRALQALNSMAVNELEAVVVVGGSNMHSAALQPLAGAGKRITLRRDVLNMAELMAWADLAVSAAGTTCWEMCLMGLPALLIDLAANQTAVARELDRRGCAIRLGSSIDVSSEKIMERAEPLLKSVGDRQAMSRRCRELVDGKGAARVVSALSNTSLHLRPAQEEDARLLWEWANDPQVRAASFSSAPIPWSTHAAWFAERRRENHLRIWIAEDDWGTPVGQIRFDQHAGGDAEIDISVARELRGQGLGVELIRQAMQSLWSATSCVRLHAFVKPENVVSVKAFEKGGFRRVGMGEVQGNEAVHLIYEAT